MHAPTIVWFRRDLRVADNPALAAACERGGPVIPVFIWAPDEEALWGPGAASRWWLHHSLLALMKSVPLVIRKGSTLAVLQQLIRETGATAVFWNRLYEPAVLSRDKAVKAGLRGAGVDAQSFNGNLLYEPWTIQTQQEKPYQVFTPYWRACQGIGDPSSPQPAPRNIPYIKERPAALEIGDLALLPSIDWAEGIREMWTPGEAGAQAELKRFAGKAAQNYVTERDRPDRHGTSRLSPHLHFGEISPRQVWAATRGAEPYRRQLIWREFAHHLLFHFPHTATEPLRPQFKNFPWRRDAKQLRAWQRGRTGFPIVDAGMRELWRTGWMHNRVRMIVASFLVKDLLLPWQEGARWFWDTLVDADLANNTLGWQWAAGCGADAAPYFRIFNPDLQAKKFDPEDRYTRTWIPAGSEASPIVSHAEARDAALAAYDMMKTVR